MASIKRDFQLEEHRLTADERPKKKYVYFVTGRNAFPFDMLRYDGAWPSRSEDAAKLDWQHSTSSMEPRALKLESFRAPTIARWSSFGWTVGFEAAQIVGKVSVDDAWHG
jgi:hypothetical protein